MDKRDIVAVQNHKGKVRVAKVNINSQNEVFVSHLEETNGDLPPNALVLKVRLFYKEISRISSLILEILQELLKAFISMIFPKVNLSEIIFTIKYLNEINVLSLTICS